MENKEQILSLYDQSALNLELSHAAKNEILSLLMTSRMVISDFGALRSYLFKKAVSVISASDPVKVLAWLEESLKLIERVKEPVRTRTPEVYFSPGEDCRRRIRQTILEAKSTIDICVFTISDNFISDTIMQKQNEGIRIRIITDDDKCYDEGSDIHKISLSKVPVRIDNSPALMHNKFAIIDNAMIITGSYNWTRSAAMDNRENIVVIHDVTVAMTYLKVFEKLWKSTIKYYV